VIGAVAIAAGVSVRDSHVSKHLAVLFIGSYLAVRTIVGVDSAGESAALVVEPRQESPNATPERTASRRCRRMARHERVHP
jgi:hypothetical protein